MVSHYQCFKMLLCKFMKSGTMKLKKTILKKDESLGSFHCIRRWTRANTGHAVLISTPRSPKMKRRNGRTDGRTDGRLDGWTDGWTDGRTDRPSYRDARTHLKTWPTFQQLPNKKENATTWSQWLLKSPGLWGERWGSRPPAFVMGKRLN